MVKTIFEALNYGKDYLKEHCIESYLIDASILLCHIKKCDKNYLLVHKNDILSDEELSAYIELIERRAKKMPVKYLTGICEFYSLDFFVDNNVLIPRPDTEFIIDKALSLFDKSSEIKILDLCCGSGCIGITLAKNLEKSHVTMADISDGALHVSEINIANHNVKNRTKLIKKDILNEEIPGKFELIVSNPPYINEDDYENLEEDVKSYEPEIALVSRQDEYKFYKRIIDTYSENLSENGIMLLEMGYNQWEYLSEYADNKKIFEKIEVIKDYGGINRVLFLKKG